MIPQAFLTEWQASVPWPDPSQVEQDLILSRLMIEVAQSSVLGPEFVMRGGTCLHKLHLPTPRRYSEDLDYVRRSEGGIRPYIDELREIAAQIGLEVSAVDFSGQMVHVTLDAEPTAGSGQIRIKVETNIAERAFFSETTTIDFEVESRWWSGEAAIPTFTLEELMATKFRALYQRRKGRDLFDLWLVLANEDVRPSEIVAGLRHYMRDSVFGYPELRANLIDKLANVDFRTDLDALVTEVPQEYGVEIAADVVVTTLGALLDNAPPVDEIRDGLWRR